MSISDSKVKETSLNNIGKSAVIETSTNQLPAVTTLNSLTSSSESRRKIVEKKESTKEAIK